MFMQFQGNLCVGNIKQPCISLYCLLLCVDQIANNVHHLKLIGPGDAYARFFMVLWKPLYYFSLIGISYPPFFLSWPLFSLEMGNTTLRFQFQAKISLVNLGHTVHSINRASVPSSHQHTGNLAQDDRFTCLQFSHGMSILITLLGAFMLQSVHLKVVKTTHRRQEKLK